jgi:hypothetical protein
MIRAFSYLKQFLSACRLWDGCKWIFAPSFPTPPRAAYLIFSSHSGFTAGYTRFSRPGNRVGLHASTGSRSGVFAKLATEGATGIAFINTETETAQVKLTAVGNDGLEIAKAELEVSPGAKLVGTAANIFSRGIGAATFIRYFSNRTIIGYELNLSMDREMLDGLPGIDQYIDK